MQCYRADGETSRPERPDARRRFSNPHFNILSFDPDGKIRRTVATGLRNASGITLHPTTGRLWAVINERDGLGVTHSAPLQVVFYEGADFPADYKGSAFVTLHGSWDRSTRTGYKVVRLLFDNNGKPA